MSPRLATNISLGLLLVLTLAGGGLRLDRLDEGLWLDELHTAWAASGEFGEVAPRAEMGNTSPLYFFIQWIVVQAFGLSESSLRALSVASGTAMIPLLYLLVYRWSGSRSASLLAALLAAIDPQCLYYSQEARVYSLLQMTATIQILVLSGAVQSPRWSNRVSLVLLTAALFYLHYTSILLLLAEMFYLGAAALLLRPRPSRWLILDGAIAGLLCLPAMGHVLDVAARRDHWAKFVDFARFDDLLNLFAWRVELLLPACLLLIVISLRAIAGWRPLANRAWPNSRMAHGWLFATCWLVLPIAIALFLNNYDIARLFHRRWLMIAAAAPIALGSLCCASLLPRSVRALGAATIGLAAVWSIGPLPNYLALQRPIDRESGEGWKEAVHFIQQDRATANWPVLVASGLIEADRLLANPDHEALRAYCLLPVSGIYRLDPSRRMLHPLPYSEPGPLGQEVLEEISERKGVYLIASGGNDLLIFGTYHQIEDALVPLGWRTHGQMEIFGPLVVLKVDLISPKSSGNGQPQPDTSP